MPKPRPPQPKAGRSTANGAALKPLQRYVMLISLDPESAAGLFAPDAEYRCTVNNRPARLVGRDAIRQQLSKTPPELQHSVSFFRQHPNDDCAMAEITIASPSWGKVTETVLVRMNDEGLIQEFEIIAW